MPHSQSFLNIIDLSSGRQIRAAEFGFRAEHPSFYKDGIRFKRDGKWLFISLETGKISEFDGQPSDGCGHFEGKPCARLRYVSEPENGVSYVELVLDTNGEKRVLARFMGGESSLGEQPFSSDFSKIVFIGYPSEDGIN